MARKFLTSIDLNLSELQNAVIQNLAANPTTGNTDGRIYYNTVADEMRVYANGSWQAIGSGDINSVLGTANEVDVSVVDGTATISLPATINADTSGNAATATKLATARAIALTGDVTGTANFDGSAGIEISATIAANSVALGTDTTGDYVTSVSASDGISATGTGEGATVALTNTDKGSSQNIFKNVAVTGQSDIVADSNNDTLTIAAGSGIGITTNATTDTVTIANSGVLSVSGTTNQITAGTTDGAVTLSLPSAVTFPGTVTLNANPTQALEAATKQYVDAVAEGLHIHASVATATTANIVDLADPPASLDGVTLTDGMRVLVKNQTATAENGIYVYDLATTALVRASDFNTAAEIQGGDFVFSTGGTTYNNTGWVQTEKITTLGTDPIVWDQFSGAGTYTAGNGLTLTGTVFSINTGVTADLSTAQTLTNKTLTSPVVSGLYLSDNNIIVEGTDDTHETTLTFTDPTQDNTITFKNATGTVAFTGDITSAIDALTTTDIEEGTNLYFTDERAQDAVGNNLSGSNSLAATYNDGAGTFAFDTTLATTSYMSKSSGLAVDASALGTKLVTDGFTKKYSASVGNASNTSFAVTHNLNTRDVQVQIYDSATYDTVEADVVRTDVNTVTVLFSTAPTSNAYRVVVIG
jgi:hypothetical protein